MSPNFNVQNGNSYLTSIYVYLDFIPIKLLKHNMFILGIFKLHPLLRHYDTTQHVKTREHVKNSLGFERSVLVTIN